MWVWCVQTGCRWDGRSGRAPRVYATIAALQRERGTSSTDPAPSPSPLYIHMHGMRHTFACVVPARCSPRAQAHSVLLQAASVVQTEFSASLQLATARRPSSPELTESREQSCRVPARPLPRPLYFYELKGPFQALRKNTQKKHSRGSSEGCLVEGLSPFHRTLILRRDAPTYMQPCTRGHAGL
jgi:hypothetical protein